MNHAVKQTWRGDITGNLFSKKRKDWFVVSGEVEVRSLKAYRPRGSSQQVVSAGWLSRGGVFTIIPGWWERTVTFSPEPRISLLDELGSDHQVHNKRALLILKRRDSKSDCRKAGLFLIAHKCNSEYSFHLCSLLSFFGEPVLQFEQGGRPVLTPFMLPRATPFPVIKSSINF